MDKKVLGIIVILVMIITIISTVLILQSPETIHQQTNEKIGLVINSPSQSTTLQELDQIYSKASETGIGRSNVYLFWNMVEPVLLQSLILLTKMLLVDLLLLP